MIKKFFLAKWKSFIDQTSLKKLWKTNEQLRDRKEEVLHERQIRIEKVERGREKDK